MNKVRLCLLALLFGVLTGCQDDDSFSTNVSNILSFTADTVRLDTVFSAVPTTTRTFWVHNESGDGIRCTNIRLQRGNQSGFRVNVDGVYLGAESGYQTSDVEIRKGDSIRVFVELTSAMNGKDKPYLVEDNLLFRLESGVTQQVNLNAYSWDAIKYRDVHIRKDTTLTGDKPIIVYGKLTVEENATLTLAAGTTLYFHDGGGIDVYGRLCSEGEAGKEVILRGDRVDWMFDYLPYDLMSGLWSGVHFYGSSYDNVMEFTDLHSAFNGIVCDSANVEKQKLTLKNMTVHNCQGTGLGATNCKVTAENCQFTNTLYECVDIKGGDVTLNHCTLAQFYPFDSNRRPALSYHSTANMPLLRMDCINSIVTGYPEDVVNGATENEEIPFNYRFISSILRTPKVEDAAHVIDVIFENVEDTASIQGEKHFKLVDLDRQHYDFHLDPGSPAVNKGNTEYPVSNDRDGKTRDGQPDIGCFEEIKSN